MLDISNPIQSLGAVVAVTEENILNLLREKGLNACGGVIPANRIPWLRVGSENDVMFWDKFYEKYPHNDSVEDWHQDGNPTCTDLEKPRKVLESIRPYMSWCAIVSDQSPTEFRLKNNPLKIVSGAPNEVMLVWNPSVEHRRPAGANPERSCLRAVDIQAG